MTFIQSIRDTLRYNRNLQLLTMQAVLTQFCFSMVKVIWQPYMIDYGIGFTELGTIQTVITIFTSLGSLVWGRLSDSYGRKPVHIASMITRIIAIIFAYKATNWYGFLGFGVFIGLSASWTHNNPVTTTFISESVKKDDMNTALSIYSSAGTLLAVVASPLGGYLAANQGYYLIFISCILGELLNVLAARWLTETLDNGPTSETQLLDIKSLLIPEPELRPYYVINMLSMLSWSIAFSNLNAILVSSYGLTTVQLGLMASGFSLSWGLTQAPLGVLIDKYPKRQFLLASRIGFLLIALGYLFSRSYMVFMLLTVINGVSHSLGIPSSTSMVLSQTSKEQRSTVMAKLATLPQIISVPGPIIGGYLFERLGFSFIVSIRVVLLVISFFVVWFWIPAED